MKRFIFTTLLFIFSVNVFIAGEGMWLPLLLKSLNESEMQAMGMKLTAEDIYSVNRGSLKDAIVHFGGFCTSQIISEQGLLLTNHHCGYSQIQSHSSIDNNLLRKGFWARTMDEELPNPGLFARLIDRIEDVTEAALTGVQDNMTDTDRQAVIDRNLETIKKSIRKERYQEVMIRPFYHGNQYFAFVTTTYNDVRLVGTPPESIGKFGADTDNWVWPRHTGDFALFRIYAGPDNLPANYSEDNVPFRPKHALPVSVKGVKEGDFTMVFGFPGRTQEYLPAVAVEQVINTLNPARIAIREAALNIIDKYMREDEIIRIKYASKFARVANYWKKWIGESLGLKKTGALEKKRQLEEAFVLKQKPKSPTRNILNEFKSLYAEIEPYAFTRDYYSEVAGRNIELMRIVSVARRLADAYKANGLEGYNGYKSRIYPFLQNFYKDYQPDIDQEVFAALTRMYATNVDKAYVPEELSREYQFMRNLKDFTHYADYVYSNTALTSMDKITAIIEKPAELAVMELEKDEAYKLGASWKSLYDEKVAAPYNVLRSQIDSLQRVYMKALMSTFPDKRFYPDANGTMRITYGQVDGYNPSDAVHYHHITYLDGVMEKYKPGDYEFDVDQKLRDLYTKKDYGPYADDNGKLPVCFIGTNHTTGGNSGSPAVNGEGHLIGLNFDRAWEGTMSDMNYDASICRNIMVDVRYILFVIDKYAGAGHLIEEMELVGS